MIKTIVYSVKVSATKIKYFESSVLINRSSSIMSLFLKKFTDNVLNIL
jgi:hypothetical protein